MRQGNVDIGISTEGSRLSAIADEFANEVADFGLQVAAEKREDYSTKASLDWVLPTAVAVWLTNKYVGTLLQEAAKDHYPKLRKAILRLARRTTGRDREVKLTVIASSPAKVTDPEPAVLSVWITLPDSRAVVFRFDHSLSPDELASAVGELFALVLAHSQSETTDSVLTRAPSALPGSRSVPVVMRFNPATGNWQSWVFDTEGRGKPSSNDAEAQADTGSRGQ